MAVALRVGEQPRDLVEEHEIGGRPAGRAPCARRSRPADGLPLPRVEQPLRRDGERVRVPEQPGQDLLRPDLRPHRLDVRADRPRPRDPVHPRVRAGSRPPLRLHLQQPHDPRPDALPPDVVGQVLRPYVRHDPSQLVPGHPPAVRTLREDERVEAIGLLWALRLARPLRPLRLLRPPPGSSVTVRHPRVQGPAEHLRHPGVVLHGRRALVVLRRDRVPGDLVRDRRLAYTRLAQRRQHLRDVGEEGAVGAEDQQSAAADALRVGVEEVRGPVQPDGRLAGAGGALDTDGGAEIRPHEVVLLRLDGGGDVPHGAEAGPLDLGGEKAAGAGGDRAAGYATAVQALVLQPREVGRVTPAPRRPPEATPDGDTPWITGTRLVEGPRHRRPPVDDERRHSRSLTDPQPPDVIALPGVIGVRAGAEVEPPEEQRPLGQLPHLLGTAAQPVPEHLGVRPRRGDVLPDDDLFPRALDHGGEGGAAGVVIRPLVGERAPECGVHGRFERGHSTEPTEIM